MGRGRIVVGMGVVSLGLGLACGDDQPIGTALDEGPPSRGGSGGGAAAGGHGGGPGRSPPAIPINLPLLDGFAPGSFCEGDHWCWYNPTPVGNGWMAVET